jgi:type IV pilus assembly protein PilX
MSQNLRRFPSTRTRRQRGISLVVILMFLVVMTLMGLSASLMSISGEKMAGNSRDQSIALQAAEAALRDARTDIITTRQFGGHRTGATGTCDSPDFKGFCTAHSGASDVAITDSDYLENKARSVGLGEITKQTSTVVGVSATPRYLIEAIPDNTGGGSVEVGSARYIYRITAIGYGANQNTKVIVQEVVRF